MSLDLSAREPTDWFALAVTITQPIADLAIRHAERLDAGAERSVIVLDEWRKEKQT